MAKKWTLNGELILNCSCTVFCPCVVSLGVHPPTEGYCQGWAGIQIEDGYFGNTKLDGLNAGILLDIPGNMGRGNWTAALYIDERADDFQAQAIEEILTGQAGGSTGVLRVLVGQYLGAKRVPISYAKNGDKRVFNIPRKIDAVIEPVMGANGKEPVVIKNSGYWIAPDIIVSKATTAKIRDFGRVWDFGGRSAEFCRLEWSGP
ncbi:MAG: DUF1326 domain-containing protein [Rhodospirillales bacterium]|jgi:hypothetical protein|nr:DUF1326 domain-containing protein [Rhodospirillales bacterium]MBT4040380.1 DUF1326 domain-containing protein [Rhodospirillales bacterium]MBT4627303.1 DUF1326 domain-containing protein [Rhodospirillales bacterium]MBT5351266.1 DUF1326 domain-containing protein [Rhodospirillales bacterium]MBT5520103.1 DUF1326 domain-containing protein [Rhodospirillales bacterium]